MGVQVILLIFDMYKIFPFLHIIFLEFDPPINFVVDSFVSWLSAAKLSVSDSLDIFARNYSGYSLKHPDFCSITSLVSHEFLPLTELESAFSGRLTFTEPSTLSNP